MYAGWLLPVLFFYAICFFLRVHRYVPEISLSAVIWPQFIQGIALACFLMPLTTLTLAGLPNDKLASTTSLANFFRTLAGSIDTSITPTMWNNRASLHHSQLVENINIYNNQTGALELQGLSQEQIYVCECRQYQEQKA